MAQQEDYIPRPIGELIIWAQNYVNYIGLNVALLAPITAAVSTALTAAFNAMLAAINGNETAQAAAQAANDLQTQRIAEFDVLARSVAQQMQSSPTVTDQQREAAGLPVYDDILTPVTAPTTRPVVEVDISQRNRVLLKWADEATPTRKAKPPGVRECEIRYKISETEPPSANDYLYLAGDSATPYLAEFDNTDAGKTVWFILRWKSTRGEFGPWSFPISAKIPG